PSHDARNRRAGEAASERRLTVGGRLGRANPYHKSFRMLSDHLEVVGLARMERHDTRLEHGLSCGEIGTILGDRAPLLDRVARHELYRVRFDRRNVDEPKAVCDARAELDGYRRRRTIDDGTTVVCWSADPDEKD